MRVVEHVVRSVDTIQSIAVEYLHAANRWRDIVDFNNLDYPYTTDDPNFQTLVAASGTLTVTRSYAATAVTVPAGTIFYVPIVEGTPSRFYTSVSDVVIAVGLFTASIPVQCTIAGFWGNTSASTITQIQTNDLVLQGAFTSITNTDPFTNGATRNVKLMGDSLLIPIEGEWDGEEAYTTITDFYDRFFGADLELGDDGDLVFDGYGDIGSVAGPTNLVQAVRDRLLTPRSSLVYHPEYGSILDQVVGGARVPYTRKWVTLAITESLLADDRIASVSVVSVTITGSRMDVVVDVQAVNRGQRVRVPATLSGLPIAA